LRRPGSGGVRRGSRERDAGRSRRPAPSGPRARPARVLGRDNRAAARVRVAYYSPLPPSRSAIADYSALLIPALEERMEVVAAKPGRFRRDPDADVALYHLGTDPAEHGCIVGALRARAAL